MEEKFMKLAFDLAQKSVGFTSPNPVVGAVIIKNGKIIGQGYHHRAGDDHAEIVAIKSVKNKKLLIGSILYVTLEPCTYYGKTPPCVEAIIKVGIKKVCVGMIDPNKKINGKGIRMLKSTGIEVEILDSKTEIAKEIRKLNQPFIKWVKFNLPYVILKAAVSLDGKIATRTGDSKWISGEESRVDARLERSKCDAVMVGSGTVKADNPELAPHGKFKNKNLLRVIIDADLSTNTKSGVYRDKNVMVATTKLAIKKNQDKFRKAGIEFKICGNKTVDIITLLHRLSEQGVQKLFVEGGAGVHGSFYDAFLKNNEIIDEVIFYIAPIIIGGKNAMTAVRGEGISEVYKVIKFKSYKVDGNSRDIKVRGIFNKY